MAQEWAKGFYNSKAWQVCRKSYISKRICLDGGLCERCHEAPGYILHHKIHLTETNIQNPDIALNHCNLEYLCKKCHDNEHFCEIHDTKQAVSLDCNGRIVPERE